ncbi:sulfatase family protein [Tichowtungia aerotolerans]|uniref:Sulfatase-like hydrolase/transferase n=1 Tax=Tichowtungia aerotolerans TaxID=2697043 RepID=A0A6P1MET0_9BACT|nr:arylsulfatase [Tichowtungia aerotolerans]QHI70126.1 sulfatase-like hydrolase/transferase [Tichowtungia aerotolerans]
MKFRYQKEMCGLLTLSLAGVVAAEQPNIVYFYVDDMGYGDAGCYNPTGKIKTPNLDKFASEGMLFTDAHSTAAVCSPSRYSLLTGRYSWRSTLQQYIVELYGEALIDKDLVTVPKLLAQNGYHTGMIGKWHLGMSWDFEVSESMRPDREAVSSCDGYQLPVSEGDRKYWHESFSKPVLGGPVAAGFESFFGVDVPNWPPYAYIQDQKLTEIPTEQLPKRLQGNNLASMVGPAVSHWNFEQLLPTFADKADRFIKEHAAQSEPFFLYLPVTSPHTPLSVNKQWIGKSGLNNLYADLVMETDDIFGQVLASLKKHGVEDNTLVIFSSDNGCAHYIGIRKDASDGCEQALEPQGHFPSGPFRGYKSDIWEGGHRVPFVVRWPGVIQPGTVSDQFVSQVDLLATCADILEVELPANVGVDSFSMLPLLKGEDVSSRDHLISHSIRGKFAIRKGAWKLVLCSGSGGWTLVDADATRQGLPPYQLYNMEDDPAESKNLYAKHPDIVKNLLSDLESYVANGRTTPGPSQENDTGVDLWKVEDRSFLEALK